MAQPKEGRPGRWSRSGPESAPADQGPSLSVVLVFASVCYNPEQAVSGHPPPDRRGGAHDFNNMLTAIIGYSEMVMMDCREDDPIYLQLEVIKKSAERASTLTRQPVIDEGLSIDRIPWPMSSSLSLPPKKPTKAPAWGCSPSMGSLNRATAISRWPARSARARSLRFT